MNWTKLIFALLSGGSSVLLTLLLFRATEDIGAFTILLLPGLVVAMITAGNVHAFPAWVACIGNFGFWFGIVYLGSAIWERYGKRVG